QDRNDTIANDNNDVRIQRNEIRSIGPYQIHVARRPTLVELNIPVLRPSQPCQFLPESPNVGLRFRVTFRVGHQDADPPHLTGLLRACRERPSRRAAKQRYELASLHSITSSAATSSLSGTVRLSIRAVSALITSSNLVARRTGRSAGFPPLRARPV